MLAAPGGQRSFCSPRMIPWAVWRAVGSVWRRASAPSAELAATRKPRLLFRFDGVFLLRFADRQFLAALFQLPPRFTRFEAVTAHRELLSHPRTKLKTANATPQERIQITFDAV